MNFKHFETEMTRLIPSFAGFTEFTTTIPKIYWDVKSQEQRILGICKLLNKVICYADMLGEKTDEIAKVLKDIQDGKLDDLITASIEKWFSEHEEQILADILDLQTKIAMIDPSVKIYNSTYDIKDYFNISNDENGLYIEMRGDLSVDDLETFKYAGKSINEIFNPNADWCVFMMPDTISNIPYINGINPSRYGEISLNTKSNLISFNSSGNFSEKSAYLQWKNIPCTQGHIYAILATCDFYSYNKGRFGIESQLLAFAQPAIGSKQILGGCREQTSDTFSIVVGNVPQNASLYVWNKPDMLSYLYDLAVIDLTKLFADGVQDEPANFVNAFYLYQISKNLNTIKTKTRIATYKSADMDDLDAYNTFIELMNEYAFDMKFANTVFRSASGYPNYPTSDTYSLAYNNLSCPLDMMRALIACSTNSYLRKIMSLQYDPLRFGFGWQSTTITPTNGLIDSTQNIPYKRIYGKGGSLNRTFTTDYAPYGVVNNAAACTLTNGHIGFISVMNTPFNTGSGLTSNSVLSYYYWIQQALNQIIRGTDPESVTYDERLAAAMTYEAQPCSFAAFIAPSGWDAAALLSQSTASFLAWIKEAKLYLGNNDGSDIETQTQVVTASVAKLFTAWIAVNECDLHEIIDIHATDYIGGSGAPQLQSAQRAAHTSMTLKDAIACMLYYSDNTLATAIARHVGARTAGKAGIGNGLIYL